jgi:cytoskeletal protein CcmA (bactofilin family)
MGVGPQGIKGLGKYFSPVRESVESGQEAASTAVGVIIDTIANGPAALIGGDTASSVIGSELHVKGTLMCTGNMTIEGTVAGDIRGKAHVTIGESGVVAGNIYAEEVIVRGEVEGSIIARKVRLCRSCHVKGEVVHARLEVENGAFFEGDCDPSDDPLAQSPLEQPVG